MTSPAPLLFDTYYHIYNRGVNRVNIFMEERNYEYFLQLYEKHIEPVVDTFGYCLLRNHFHLLVRVKSKGEIQSQIQAQSLRVFETLRDSLNKVMKLLNFLRPNFIKLLVLFILILNSMLVPVHREATSKVSWDQIRGIPYPFLVLTEYRGPCSPENTFCVEITF